MSHRTVSPAYGRDYKNARAARADWFAEKDFMLQPDNTLLNRQQVMGEEVNIRYRQLRSVTVVKPDEES